MKNENADDQTFQNRSKQLERSMARFKHTPLSNLTESPDEISKLIDLHDFEELSAVFNQATGLGVSCFDSSFNLIANSGWQKICSRFHKQHPEAHKACSETLTHFKKHLSAEGPISYKCKNGLWDLAYPLLFEDKILGCLIFGQFFYQHDPVDKHFFVEQAQKYQFEKDAYIDVLKEVPIISQEKLEAYTELFVTSLEKTIKLRLH